MATNAKSMPIGALIQFANSCDAHWREIGTATITAHGHIDLELYCFPTNVKKLRIKTVGAPEQDALTALSHS